MNPSFWLYGGTVLYLIAMGWTVIRVLHRRAPSVSLNLFLVLSGFLAQSFGLWALGIKAQSCPIRNPFEVLHFISWSIMVLYWLTGSVFRVSLLGVGSAFLAAILSAAAPFFLTAEEPVSIFGGNHWIEGHAALALLSYGAFGILTVSAALYLLQNYSLKTKSAPASFRYFPSISSLEKVIFRLLLISLVLYSASILLGALYLRSTPTDVNLIKILFTLGVWVGYLAAFFLFLFRKISRISVARLIIALFAFALIALVPVEQARVFDSAQEEF